MHGVDVLSHSGYPSLKVKKYRAAHVNLTGLPLPKNSLSGVALLIWAAKTRKQPSRHENDPLRSWRGLAGGLDAVAGWCNAVKQPFSALPHVLATKIDLAMTLRAGRLLAPVAPAPVVAAAKLAIISTTCDTLNCSPAGWQKGSHVHHWIKGG